MRFGEEVFGGFVLVVLAVVIGPGSEGSGQAGIVGAELEGAALEPVFAGDHRVPALSWAGIGWRGAPAGRGCGWRGCRG